MKSFKKLGKAFLTLALIVGAVFAGLAIPGTTQNSAEAYWSGSYQNYFVNSDSSINMYYCAGDGDTLIGVDSNGYVYKGTSASNFAKTGVMLSGFGIPTYDELNYITHFKNIYQKNRFGINLMLNHNGTIVVLGYDEDAEVAYNYISLDNGDTWTRYSTGYDVMPYYLTYGNGIFLAVYATGEHSIAMTSADGINWSVVSELFFPNSKYSGTYAAQQHVGFANGHFVSIDFSKVGATSLKYNGVEYTQDFVVSLDCENWESVGDDTAIINSNTVYSSENGGVYFETYGNQYLVAFNNNIWLTSDFTTFTAVGTWGDDIYWLKAVGSGYLIATSTHVEYFEIINGVLANETTICYINKVHDNSDDVILQGTFTYTDAIVTDSKIYLVSTGNGFIDGNAVVTEYFRDTTNHTVTVKDWNGNIITTLEVSDGEIITGLTSPTRDGYTFTGWDYDITQPITQDITITAQYEIRTYEITFRDWNGQFIASVTKEYGSVLTDEDVPSPVRDGYSFTGWDKEINQTITSELTFIAQYSRELTLTFNYLKPSGTTGLLGQYSDMAAASITFNYIYGDTIDTNDDLQEWYSAYITPWANDFDDDGQWDYLYKFNGWDTDLPSTITNNMVVNAKYEKLITVTLVYYTQLRYKAYTADDGMEYYYAFIGYMTIDRLYPSGTIIELEDFKDPEANYHIYNASKGEFYDNIVRFEFLGWDKDITVPQYEDVTITGQYNLPQIEARLFDSEGYQIGSWYQDFTFMTIEDLQAIELSGATSAWATVRECFRLFFSLQWGEMGDIIANRVDLSYYLKGVRQYHNASRQILTAFYVADTDYPEYGGIFKNGLVAVSSPVLLYYTGTANENNMTYWINPITFSTELYTLTVIVTYSNVLNSLYKSVSSVLNEVLNFGSDVLSIVADWWWVIAIVVLLIIFRKPIGAAISMIVKAIGNGSKKLSNKIKEKKNKSKYKKAEKEYTAAKNQNKNKKE